MCIGTLPISCGEQGALDIPWYEFVRSSLGSFLSQNGTIYSEAETLVIARLYAGLQKISESLRTEFLPGTSVDLLKQWTDRLDVPVVSTDSLDSIRNAVEAKYKLTQGSTKWNLNNLLAELLGDVFISIDYHEDNLDVDGYHWYTCNPDSSIGTNTLSDDYQITKRALVTILVQNITLLTEVEFLRLVSVHISNLLNTLLPTWCTFDWTISTDGFYLALDQDDTDGSRLGFVSITDS